MKTTSVLLARSAGFFAVLSAFVFSLSNGRAACALTPERSTNTVGQVLGVTAHVTNTNGNAAPGVLVSFAIISGPNAGLTQSSTTGAGGNAIFNYTGNGGAGADIIRATGTVNSVSFLCLATQLWVTAMTPTTIICPPNIVTNAAPGDCSRSVAFTVMASGDPMPVIRSFDGTTPIKSPHTFPAGTTTVTSTASNANGVATCTFTVTVTETEPPQITCPEDVFVTAVPGDGGAIVEFDTPAASDNCSEVTATCDPPSGSFFPVGTTPVTCTVTDRSGNSTNCTFNVTVEEVQPDAHDLAVVRIRAPKTVVLNATRPAVTKRVAVTIQNRSAHAEAFFDPAQLQNLVTLSVLSLDTNICSDIAPVFVEGRPQRRIPFNLKPKRTLKVYFDVTFDCAVNAAKGFGQEDFRYVAEVHHEAIDGIADTHPECDICPRAPLDGGVDPNPNGRIRDRGCGGRVGFGVFGNDVLTDVVVR